VTDVSVGLSFKLTCSNLPNTAGRVGMLQRFN